MARPKLLVGQMVKGEGWVRVRVRAGARECITLVSFFFFSYKCGENLVFVGQWVATEDVTYHVSVLRLG